MTESATGLFMSGGPRTKALLKGSGIRLVPPDGWSFKSGVGGGGQKIRPIG